MKKENKIQYLSHEEEAKENSLDIEETAVTADGEINYKYPLKTLVAAVLLFIVGSCLIIAGAVEELVDDDASKGMAMWVIGAITFIPGFYYSVLFCKAFRAKTLAERIKILREIPDM